MHNASIFPFLALIINMFLFIINLRTSFPMKFLYDNSAEKAFCIFTDYLFHNFSFVLLDYMWSFMLFSDSVIRVLFT